MVTKIASILYIFISVNLCLVVACSLNLNLLTSFFWQQRRYGSSSSRRIVHAAPLMMQEATGFMQHSVGWLSACKSLSAARMDVPTVPIVSNMLSTKQTTGNVCHIIHAICCYTPSHNPPSKPQKLYSHFLFVTFQKTCHAHMHMYILTCTHRYTRTSQYLFSAGVSWLGGTSCRSGRLAKSSCSANPSARERTTIFPSLHHSKRERIGKIVEGERFFWRETGNIKSENRQYEKKQHDSQQISAAGIPTGLLRVMLQK